jgi:hypothetical protein
VRTTPIFACGQLWGTDNAQARFGFEPNTQLYDSEHWTMVTVFYGPDLRCPGALSRWTAIPRSNCDYLDEQILVGWM